MTSYSVPLVGTLGQWFSTRGNFAFWGTLALSRDILVVTSRREGVTGILWVGARGSSPLQRMIDLSLQAGNREQRAGRISPEAHKGPLPATKSRIPTPQVCPRPLPPTWDPRSPSCPGQTQFWAPAIPRNTSLPCSLCRVAGNISCWSSRPHCAQRSHSFILSVSQSTLSAHCGLVQGPGTVLLTARGRHSE